MNAIALVPVALTVSVVVLLVGTWRVAARAVGAGHINAALRLWESVTRVVLVVPSLVEEQCDRALHWLRSSRHRITDDRRSMIWRVVGVVVGVPAWVLLFATLRRLDIEAFEALGFQSPVALGTFVALADAVAASLIADLLGITHVWPLPAMTARVRQVTLGAAGLLFVVVLGGQGLLGHIRADEHHERQTVMLAQRVQAEAAARGTAPADAAVPASVSDRLKDRAEAGRLVSVGTPVVVGLFEGVASAAALHGLVLLLLLPNMAASGAVWTARFPVFLGRQLVTYGLRSTLDLFAAKHGVELPPEPADAPVHPPDLPETTPGTPSRIGDDPLFNPLG